MPRTRPLPLVVRIAFVGSVVLAALAVPATAVAAPVEDYASYQPQVRCAPKAKPGTVVLGRWIVKRYGGGHGAISRRCGGGTSEHSEGRAFDWSVNAARAADRRRVDRFLDRVLRTDAAGNRHALARRMGIMYFIWRDHMWASYDGFRRKPYLSSGCASRKRCSPTLRHRDHVHISLSRKGGRGRTSWYAGRLEVVGRVGPDAAVGGGRVSIRVARSSLRYSTNE